jgi:hypothetical protein
MFYTVTKTTLENKEKFLQIYLNVTVYMHLINQKY